MQMVDITQHGDNITIAVILHVNLNERRLDLCYYQIITVYRATTEDGIA